MTDHLLLERHRRIRTALAERGRVVASELAEEFGVSGDTIRRDLRDLAAGGYCERVYGGALIPETGPAPLTERSALARERKMALARTTAALIPARSTVFVDAGSTNLAVAHALARDADLTVVTNAPAIAAALAERTDLALIVIGGRVDPQIGGAVGATAIADLNRLRPDWLVLGACGVDHTAGVTAQRYEDAAFKRYAVERAGAVIVAATNEKLQDASAFSVARIGDLAHLVIEHDASAASLANCGCDIVRAGDPARKAGR
ncbi:DeoR/GlpR family DNA-binding transcription regulator [Pararhizobium mangrovi]|uniref:DeoR/GlpR transcriptional regulator n=1 Tax=Pararhizobium mangrovi TaxID=2590452 RepID=A0A506TY30_9HYPH|nr:DeoR/GlpR family DNA-binding transcription regulator [Pararhizobium mangrovi]TPW26993.1 DeoR/GlpR transcriptional regulator [Pararhizobium mangrovi]